MKTVVDIDQHLSIFRPYHRDPRHEDQLTRAALIVMMLVPLAHESFLGLVHCERLSNLPAARFDMQTETLSPVSTNTEEQEVAEFISVLLGPHETLKQASAVEVSERRARYDGVIQYGPRLLIAIESKLLARAGEQQVTKINPKGLSWGSSREPMLVQWHQLLDQWWNLSSLGLLSPTEAVILNDFFEFAETNFGDLLPFTDLERCKEHPGRLARRLRSVLEDATGLSAEVSAGRAGVRMPGDQVSSFDRIALWADADAVHLGVWPAELAAQYTRVYGSEGTVAALVALSDDEHWQLNANFHLGYRFSRPAQRWYPRGAIDGAAYVRQWRKDVAEGNAGGRSHDQIGDEFRRWLVDRRYASKSELPRLDDWLAEHPNIQIHIRPGIEILRTWPMTDAVALDATGALTAEVQESVERILKALNEPRLDELVRPDGVHR